MSGMEINGYTFTSDDDCFQGMVIWSDVPFFKNIADSFMSSQGVECTEKKLNGISYDECTSEGQVGYKYEYDGKIVILNCNRDMTKCNCDAVLYDFLNTKITFLKCPLPSPFDNLYLNEILNNKGFKTQIKNINLVTS